MSNEYLVISSNKIGLDAKESYVVVRGGFSYLRILGGEPAWELMTATASEDHGRITVCPHRNRLVAAALRFCKEQGDPAPSVVTDMAGREYVKMGQLYRANGEADEEFHALNDKLFRRFFELFDGQQVSGGRDEMRELYDALAPGDDGEEVYLSDGVWLASDGSLHGRGR